MTGNLLGNDSGFKAMGFGKFKEASRAASHKEFQEVQLYFGAEPTFKEVSLIV